MKVMIKNYSSNSKQTFDNIQKILIKHNAKSINFEYKEGKVSGIIFVLEIKDKDYGFRLPARVENVKQIFDKNGLRYDPDQPYRTAWANIRDWIDAQLALVDTEQAKIEEVFMPYMVVDGNSQSLFEYYSNEGFKQLPEPRP